MQTAFKAQILIMNTSFLSKITCEGANREVANFGKVEKMNGMK